MGAWEEARGVASAPGRWDEMGLTASRCERGERGGGKLRFSALDSQGHLHFCGL